MNTIDVEAFDDPRLADYQNLKDSNLAVRRNRFIVEGRGNLEVLLERSRYAPDSILLSQRAHRSMGDDLARWSPTCPVYVAEQSLLDQIVGFPFHRGCVASGLRPAGVDPAELALGLIKSEGAPRVLLLEGIHNLDNIGGIFRNAMALGAHAIIACPRTCDPLYRKAIRTSMGGSLCVPFARAVDWPGLLRQLRDMGYHILALDPAEEGVPIESIEGEAARPTALLLGTEGPGLSEEALALSDRRVRIDMEGGVDSINVSVASAIALHVLRRATRN
jgi:tRNA G18 (ribose-2'-O)-methylase SpoU